MYLFIRFQKNKLTVFFFFVFLSSPSYSAGKKDILRLLNSTIKTAEQIRKSVKDYQHMITDQAYVKAYNVGKSGKNLKGPRDVLTKAEKSKISKKEVCVGLAKGVKADYQTAQSNINLLKAKLGDNQSNWTLDRLLIQTGVKPEVILENLINGYFKLEAASNLIGFDFECDDFSGKEYNKIFYEANTVLTEGRQNVLESILAFADDI